MPPVFGQAVSTWILGTNVSVVADFEAHSQTDEQKLLTNRICQDNKNSHIRVSLVTK